MRLSAMKQQLLSLKSTQCIPTGVSSRDLEAKMGIYEPHFSFQISEIFSNVSSQFFIKTVFHYFSYQKFFCWALKGEFKSAEKVKNAAARKIEFPAECSSKSSTSWLENSFSIISVVIQWRCCLIVDDSYVSHFKDIIGKCRNRTRASPLWSSQGCPASVFVAPDLETFLL